MTVFIYRKPDAYYNVFIQRRNEAFARCKSRSARIVARTMGMEYYTYLQHCNEVRMLLT